MLAKFAYISHQGHPKRGGGAFGAQPLGGPMKTTNIHIHPKLNNHDQSLFWTKTPTVTYYFS